MKNVPFCFDPTQLILLSLLKLTGTCSACFISIGIMLCISDRIGYDQKRIIDAFNWPRDIFNKVAVPDIS